MRYIIYVNPAIIDKFRTWELAQNYEPDFYRKDIWLANGGAPPNYLTLIVDDTTFTRLFDYVTN